MLVTPTGDQRGQNGRHDSARRNLRRSRCEHGATVHGLVDARHGGRRSYISAGATRDCRACDTRTAREFIDRDDGNRKDHRADYAEQNTGKTAINELAKGHGRTHGKEDEHDDGGKCRCHHLLKAREEVTQNNADDDRQDGAHERPANRSLAGGAKDNHRDRRTDDERGDGDGAALGLVAHGAHQTSVHSVVGAGASRQHYHGRDTKQVVVEHIKDEQRHGNDHDLLDGNDNGTAGSGGRSALKRNRRADNEQKGTNKRACTLLGHAERKAAERFKQVGKQRVEQAAQQKRHQNIGTRDGGHLKERLLCCRRLHRSRFTHLYLLLMRATRGHTLLCQKEGDGPESQEPSPN